MHSVQVQMLNKHSVSFAIREGMRLLFGKDTMRVSVLQEINIKNSKLGTQVLDAAGLDKLHGKIDANLVFLLE